MSSSTSTDLRNKICTDVIDQSTYRNAQELADAAYKWRNVGTVCHAVAVIMMIVQSILAFTVSSYGIKTLNYVVGCVNILSIGLVGFANYCMSESSKSTEELNRILKSLNLPTVVDVAADDKNTVPADV